MINTPSIGSSHNQNCRFDKVASPETSNGLRGKEWGRVNSNVGGRTSNYEEFAFGLGVIKNYFSSFFDLEESPVVGFIVKALTGASDFLEGKRDQEMYGKVYGHGIDKLADGSMEELKNEDRMLDRFDRQEDRYVDDLGQNKRQEALYGERIVSKFGEWATYTAKVKPIAHFVSGILGNNWRLATQTILDFPARMWWRLRFFKNALHSNFVTTVWDLTKFRFMSLFGSEDASKNYVSKTKELGNLSNEYFKGKNNNGEYKNIENPGLGTYVNMLTDRIAEHWHAIWNPKAALVQKSKPKEKGGFLNRTSDEERKADPSKRFENGFVDPDADYDQKEQKRLAAVDFTGPVCAALGLVGTVVFDPLKLIWGAAGFERGKNLVNALSASRKSFSLINYVFRFIIPEMNESRSYKDREKDMNDDKNPNKKAVTELYYAKKSRYYNSVIGMAMAVGNIFEPVLHLKRGIIGDSKFGNFLIDTVIKFNDTFFLRFFSKRREAQGRLNFLQAWAQEKLGTEFVKDENYTDARLSDGEFDKAMNGRAMLPLEPSFIDKILDKAVSTLKSVKDACSGEASFLKAAQIEPAITGMNLKII